MTNREALLEAAIASLQDRGYADATARDVATRAGVSLGAIGYHYGSTQSLLDAALAEGVRRWFEPSISLLSSPAEMPTPERIASTLDELFYALAQNRPMVIAYFEALLRAERSSDLRATLATEFDGLRTALVRGIEVVRPETPASTRTDPSVAASLIMAGFDGLIIQWLLDPERLPSGKQILETLLGVASGDPEAEPKKSSHPQVDT